MISKKAAGIVPYTAGEQPRDKRYIKLNTNENPYPPSGKVVSALLSADISRLRLYPDPASSALKAAAAEKFGLKPENIFCGNGSDEILAFCFQAFFDPMGKDVIFPDVTYSFYPVWCKLFDINFRTPPLKADFSVETNDYISQKNCQGIVIANPNAPTGRALDLKDLEKVIAANADKAVVIDEAYVDFGGDSAIPLVKKYKNLVVVRTFSKSYGLAGMRIGFAAADKELIDALRRIKDSFNSYPVDFLAETAAVAALSDKEYFKAQANKVIKTRQAFCERIGAAGFSYIPSSANFVFVTHKTVTAEKLYKELKESGVLVRWFNKPRISNYLRITIGTDEDMLICAEKLIELADKR